MATGRRSTAAVAVRLLHGVTTAILGVCLHIMRHAAACALAPAGRCRLPRGCSTARGGVRARRRRCRHSPRRRPVGSTSSRQRARAVGESEVPLSLPPKLAACSEQANKTSHDRLATRSQPHNQLLNITRAYTHSTPSSTASNSCPASSRPCLHAPRLKRPAPCLPHLRSEGQPLLPVGQRRQIH